MSYIHRGYTFLWDRENKRYVKNCVQVMAENGFDIPDGMVIHHINGNRSDDRIENLSLLSRDNHAFLHHSERAESDCGDHCKRKCYICGEYDDIGNMYCENKGGHSHRKCRAKYLKEWRLKKRR